LKDKYVIKLKTSGKGRPTDDILSKIAVKLWDTKKNLPFYACKGIFEGCDYICSGNPQKNHIAPHATECRYLNEKIKVSVASYAAASSLGAKIESHDVSTTAVESGALSYHDICQQL
jgi:hypothetical protein